MFENFQITTLYQRKKAALDFIKLNTSSEIIFNYTIKNIKAQEFSNTRKSAFNLMAGGALCSISTLLLGKHLLRGMKIALVTSVYLIGILNYLDNFRLDCIEFGKKDENMFKYLGQVHDVTKIYTKNDLEQIKTKFNLN